MKIKKSELDKLKDISIIIIERINICFACIDYEDVLMNDYFRSMDELIRIPTRESIYDCDEESVEMFFVNLRRFNEDMELLIKYVNNLNKVLKSRYIN